MLLACCWVPSSEAESSDSARLKLCLPAEVKGSLVEATILLNGE